MHFGTPKRLSFINFRSSANFAHVNKKHTMTSQHKVAVISMSTRKSRVGPKVADFVTQTLSKQATENGVELSLVDVTKFNLPLFDESLAPMMVPSQGKFAHEHSNAWSAEIAKHGGYILVVGEYNHGVPGGAKNAIDYLFNEWIGKPVVIVTYGSHGGVHSSGQLNEILGGMKLRVAETRPALPFAQAAVPDIYAAVSKGALGEASRELWATEKKNDLLKAFGELRDLLQESHKENGATQA